VISQTSTAGYARDATPFGRIAKELGVGSLVEGSVQVAGDRLRLNVRLIDGATGAQLWAERYDRTLKDAFAIQSEVAQQIAAAVGAALSDDERRAMAAASTADAQAYQFYLQGRAYNARTGALRENYATAQQLFERAVAIDANFALARAALSEMHGRMYWIGHDRSPARLTRQREEAEAALRLAPDLPQAHLAMGLAHYHGRRDYRRALQELQIAMRGLPHDVDLLTSLGAVHRRLGNWDDAVAVYERAIRLDPRSVRTLYALGQVYDVTRRYADAVRIFERALSLAPDHHAAAVTRAHVYWRWQGTLDTLRAALARLPRDLELGQWGPTVLLHAQLLHAERQADSLLRLLAESPPGVLQSQGDFQPTSLYAAWAHRLRGDGRAALAAFDSARAVLDSVRKKRPNDRRVRAGLALALAGLGRHEEALREARWLEQSVEYRDDAYEGPYVALDRAQILAQAGDTDAALDEIERLLRGAAPLSAQMLRLHPIWDPVRRHPRFERLLAKYGAR
jgi:tetratricopeptide (TPR) repeat protein